MNPRPVSDWIAALEGLKRRGAEWIGPCPSCGGHDRFHVSRRPDNGLALVGCRGCIDGQDASARAAAYRAIVRAAFGDVAPAPKSTQTRPDWNRFQLEQRRRASRTAQRMLNDAELRVHPYLDRKGFPDTRMLVCGDLLLVPARGRRGKLQSLQTIAADGAKRFLVGGRMKGASHRLGRERETWIVEGLATGLSVLTALRRLYRRASVRVAFSAHNMRDVGGDFAVVDNDPWKCPDCDQPSADCCSKAVPPTGARIGRQLVRRGTPCWMPPDVGDANDFHLAHGVDALADALNDFARRTTCATPSDSPPATTVATRPSRSATASSAATRNSLPSPSPATTASLTDASTAPMRFSRRPGKRPSR